MRSFQLLSLVLSVFLSCSPSQAQHLYPRARHRNTNKLYSTFGAKLARDANVAFTNFVDGLGACGITNGPTDFIVALNSAEFDNGGHCFEMITITINGKTAQAQITDRCPGCSPGGLDLSQGLFEYFAPIDEGELYGSWSYNNGATTSSSTPPPPTTSSTPTWTSTTTMATSSTRSSTTTTTTTSSVSTVVPSPTSVTATAPASTSQDSEMIAQVNLALVELGGLLQASFKLET